jgi:adenine-specific DNA-methyltransferase
MSVLRNLGNTQRDGAELAAMGIEFTYPKPVSLMSYLLSIIKDRTALYLDFFAGSGTTAHAFAKLNAEDGGQRRFILVSSTEATEDQPNKNLCRDVCAERVRRVLGGYTNAKGEVVAGLGGGFAYLRARRIAPHRLASRIAHAEVWQALLLLHDLPLQPWREDGFQSVDAMSYLADFRAASVERLQAWAGDGAGCTIYCWSPERLRDRLPLAQWAPIPQTLRDRFGR